MINNDIIEQVNGFNYTITVTDNKELEIKINRFNGMCSTIIGMNSTTRGDTQIHFYKAMAVTYGSKIWAIYEKRCN
jgi:hypothetical protein